MTDMAFPTIAPESGEGGRDGSAGLPFDRLLPAIEGGLAALELVRGRVDTLFVRLGDDLEAVLAKVERLESEITEAVLRIQGGERTGILDNIRKLEDETGARFERNSEALGLGIEMMQTSVARLASIEKRNEVFTGNSSRMNTIAIYFSIEISRSATATAVFTSYARDIRSLFGEIIEGVSRIEHEVTENRRRQTEAMARVKSDYDAVAANARDAVRQSYATITHISQVSTDTLERVIKYFSLLGRSVARILTAIQVGDIARQQLEHVIAALEGCRQRPPTGGQGDMEWARVIALQFAQTRHVRSEIADASATIHEAAEQISAAFGILAADVDELLSGVRNVGKGGDWMSELTGELAGMCDREEKSAEVVNRTLDTLEGAFGSSRLLRRHVEEIAVNNRRLSMEAYNARILSMRLGDEGRALTTLAKEVSDLSRATQNYMEEVTGAITEVVDVAEQAAARIKGLRTVDGGGEGSAADRRRDIEELDQEICDFVRTTADACDKARMLHGEVDIIQQGLDAVNALTTDIDSALETLSGVVAILTEAFGEAGGDWAADTALADRYTMDTERLIHRQLASGTAADDVILDSTVSKRRDMIVNEEEMGENVELF